VGPCENGPKQEKLPWFAPNKEKLKRLEEAKQANGYCGLVTPPFSRLNLEDFNSLHMNIKTDGRAYFFNVLPDGFILSQDIWQATIGEEKPRPLHEKSIEIDKLTQTCRGWTKMYQVPLPRERLKGFSWTVQGRQGWKEMERLRSKVEQRKQKLKAERARVEAAAAAGGGGAGGAGVEGKNVRSIFEEGPRPLEKWQLDNDPVYREYLELERRTEKKRGFFGVRRDLSPEEQDEAEQRYLEMLRDGYQGPEEEYGEWKRQQLEQQQHEEEVRREHEKKRSSSSSGEDRFS